MTVTASGAMTAVPAGQGAIVVLAAMAPLSTETASRPPVARGELRPAARGATRSGTTPGVRTEMQAVTAATGQAG
jgi:hypothetical protein